MSCIGGKTLGAAALVVCPCELDGTGERILSRFSTIRKIDHINRLFTNFAVHSAFMSSLGQMATYCGLI